MPRTRLLSPWLLLLPLLRLPPAPPPAWALLSSVTNTLWLQVSALQQRYTAWEAKPLLETGEVKQGCR